MAERKKREDDEREEGPEEGAEEEGLEFKELRFMEEGEVEALVSKGWFHARLVYEVQQLDEATVKEALKKVVATLRAQEGVRLSDVQYTTVERLNEKVFSMVGDVGVLAKGFDVLMMLVLNVTPSNVVLLEPERATLSLQELQGVLGDVGQTLEHMANENYQLGLQVDALARGKSLKPKE